MGEIKIASMPENTEAETAYLRAMEMLCLFDIEKLNPNLTLHAYVIGVDLYCKNGNPGKALELLEKFTDLCIHGFFPFKLRGDGFFTDIGPWLDSCETGASLPSDEKLIKQNMLQGLTKYPSFAVLADEPQYKRIVQKLTEFVNVES